MKKNSKKQKKSRALEIVRKFFPGVKRVNDSIRAIEIEVTGEDSATSKALNHRTCALAVACKRGLQADGVIIGIRTAYVVNGHAATRYRLPENVAREIVSFDRRAGFALGTYVLQAPAKGEQLGEGHSGQTRNPSERKVRMRHMTANIRAMLSTNDAVAQ